MAILAREIRSTIEKLRFRDYIVWHYLPQGAYLCTRLGERMNVYEIVDDYGSFPGVRRSLADRLEHNMFKNADAVFAISENLAESRQSGFPGIHVVPIGVDYDHFEKSSNPGAIPEDIVSIPDPRIGYYGGIDFRLDVDLVAAAAERLKNMSFVFIGPDKERILQQLMSLYKNIRYLGPKPYKSIPDYLRGFSICMLPYRLSEFTRNIYPNKIFEYLASGKPVVATDIPSIRALAEQGYIRTIAGEGEFWNVLSEALSDQDACARERRINLASENSWESRVRKMENIIEEILK